MTIRWQWFRWRCWTGLCWGVLAAYVGAGTAGDAPPGDAPGSGPGLAAPTADAPLRDAVRADWERQEKRLGRAPYSAEAIRAALGRARLLLDDLGQGRTGAVGDLSPVNALCKRLADEAARLAALDEPARRDLYDRIRWLGRNVALRNPAVASQPIAFMLRRRAVGYMLYEYLGWYYRYGNDPTSGFKNSAFPTPEPGGGVFVLESPGQSMSVKELTVGRFPPGHFVTLSADFDAKRLYFAYANPKGEDPYTLPEYAQSPAVPGVGYDTFHLWTVATDGSGLQQLTEGPNDDFDPCPLPDGGIAFESTRRGSKLRCGGGSPELVYTLNRMDANGQNVHTLSFHETHEWHPSVLGDGRIVFTRWDYVDRNAAKFHGLWTCNPDGTAPSILFGNYTTLPWACYQAKAVPGSQKVMFVAGGHHANVGGTLMMLDPSRIALDPKSGEDCFSALERLTPEVCFAEAQGWPKSFFYSPWPLSENYFLVSFSHDPLPGGYTGCHRDSETGLYYFDRFGNLELLFRREGISAVYPIPLAPRTKPPVRLGATTADWGPEGEFVVADVRKSLLPMPADRKIRQLRVFQLLPKARSDNADNPRMGHPDQANARMLLGTVPVEDDGSAYFRAPARKPLFFQAVDTAGRAVQGMRTVVYLQPGERRGCVGCHEPPGLVAASDNLVATRRPPSVLQPGPDGTFPFCYPRLIQPLLDRWCVACHDGTIGPDKSPVILTGGPEGRFTKSYESLKPFLRWPSYDAVTRPGQVGADLSPLSAILTEAKHRKHLTLPDAELRTLYLWMDAHVPFYGVYEVADLEAQKLGRLVDPPRLQ